MQDFQLLPLIDEEQVNQKKFKKLTDRTWKLFSIDDDNADMLLRALQDTASARRDCLDVTGWGADAAAYCLILLCHTRAWEQGDNHDAWHSALEASNLGASCGSAQGLADVAARAMTISDNIPDLLQNLREHFFDTHDPQGTAENYWKVISHDITRENAKSIALGCLGAVDGVSWGDWQEDGERLTSVVRDMVRVNAQTIALEMLMKGLIYAVNAGRMHYTVIGSVWDVFRDNNIEPPSVSAEVDGVSAIRNAIGEILGGLAEHS